MRRKAMKKKMDEELLETIYNLQWEWKRQEGVLANSIEPSDDSIYQEKIAKAKFMFLLREARHLNIHATKYH